MIYFLYMNPQSRQCLKDYEIKRFHRIIDKCRIIYAKTDKYNFVKAFFLKKRILSETQNHFDILNKLYENDSTKNNHR